jgi:ribonucleoside-diphosphate reductase alpha chain
MDAAISRDIWASKYRYVTPAGSGESGLEESLARVAQAVAAAEKPGEQARWRRAFLDLMEDLAFIPAGRILAGAGTGRDVTLFNCFVMGRLDDSITGIFDGLKEAALTLQQGGGIGHDFSTLRPKGAIVHSVGADASGPLSFMDCWDAMCRTIMSAGARRGAMMGTLACDHPDIEAFVEAKRDKRLLRNFNVSVLVSDAFMAAVAADGPWPLRFGGQTYRTVSAAALWQKIMRATYDVAEPGVIFIDRVNGLNPLSYCETIACTNPCGEQPLPPYGACLLGSLNLTRFVTAPFSAAAQLAEDRLAEAAALAIRFLDNVIEVSNYPLPQQRAEALAKRRLGLGVTGLANALAMLGLRYGSEAAADATRRWMAVIQQAAIAASAALAAEKGSFPRFDATAYLATTYGQRLDEVSRQLIRRTGLRNGLLTSVAPTGTISLLAGNVSSGIEPVFALAQERRILGRDGSHRSEHLEDYGYSLWRRQAGRAAGARAPAEMVTVADLSPREHLVMQQAAQAHVDSSISKTINVPEDFPFASFVSVYEEAYRMGLKGCTTFRPNAVTGSVLTAQPGVGKAGEGRLCPACGSPKLAAKEGCMTCVDCGFALCGA